MKSIEELAREFVTQLEGRFDADAPFGDLRNWPCYIALKSALSAPPAEAEWPQYFRMPSGDILECDSRELPATHWTFNAGTWSPKVTSFGYTACFAHFSTSRMPKEETQATLRPVTQWPKYFRSDYGGIIRFDSEAQRGTWEDGEQSIAWHYGTVLKTKHFHPIPAAEALAIIERASNP